MSTATAASSAPEFYVTLRESGHSHESAVDADRPRLPAPTRRHGRRPADRSCPPCLREPAGHARADRGARAARPGARRVRGAPGRARRAGRRPRWRTIGPRPRRADRLESEGEAGPGRGCSPSARAEIEHVELARAESIRREREEQQQAAQQAVADAMHRAAEIGADRLQAAEKVDLAARALGEALAEHQGACHAQLRALSEAGRDIRWDQVFPRDDTLRSALIAALFCDLRPGRLA